MANVENDDGQVRDSESSKRYTKEKKETHTHTHKCYYARVAPRNNPFFSHVNTVNINVI